MPDEDGASGTSSMDRNRHEGARDNACQDRRPDGRDHCAARPVPAAGAAGAADRGAGVDAAAQAHTPESPPHAHNARRSQVMQHRITAKPGRIILEVCGFTPFDGGKDATFSVMTARTRGRPRKANGENHG